MAETIQGPLPAGEKWQMIYASSTPLETNNGYEPQTIFRLVNQTITTNSVQQVYFRINRDVPSASPNKNESNGLLLFNHYQDGDNLYYAGLRVDGTAVIKKKQNGLYATLAQAPVLQILPQAAWLGVRSEISTTTGGVLIKLYLDLEGSGRWWLAATALDATNPILSGAGGIRTDFMDVSFRDYKLEY